MRALVLISMLVGTAGAQGVQAADLGASLPKLVELLTSHPGGHRKAPTDYRWVRNYFWKVHLCLPKGGAGFHRGVYENACGLPRGERGLAKALHAIDRSPENLRRLYDRHKEQAFAVISPALYRSTGAHSTVRALRAAYDFAAKTPELQAKLRGVHQKVLARRRQATLRGRFGWRWVDLYVEAYLRHGFKTDPGIDASWALSFWARRLAEGNVDVVRTILDDIAAHYGAAPPTP